MVMKDVGKQKLENNNSFIRLSLRKPREWKVALTTSVSSPAIVPPVIQLWDAERGSVLVDTSHAGRRAWECVRSKSASFTRRGAESPAGAVKDLRSFRSNCNKDGNESRASLVGQYKEAGRQIRSKSLSNRQEHEKLVSPGDCVRLRTPVMVARRISLTKDNSSQTSPVERSCSAESTLQLNGITTHHRKQHSDSIMCSNRRRVKNNVSFGRVDTIDDTSGIYSSFSLMRSRGTSNIKSTDSERSTPRITITEAVDNNEKTAKDSKSRHKHERSKERSHSGIPVLVKGQKDSSSSCSHGNRARAGHDSKMVMSNVIQKDEFNRKGRMEMLMQNDTNRINKFNPTRVFNLPEPPPLLPPSAYLDLHPNCQCNRGNCPMAKYFSQVPDQVKSVSRREVRGDNHDTRQNYSNGLQATNSHVKNDMKVNKTNETLRYDKSKPRKKRVASRSRQEVMSSSSSDSEQWTSTRHPPWRKRQSQSTKGDRLVGVNGQLVKTPREAEELLKAGGDVVRLHLQRAKDAGVSQSLSLPRRTLDKDQTMGSNMSRHSGKGLTGRRSQSSGNLCNGKAPAVARIFSPCGRDPQDRYKLCGSLPNHLDSPPPASDVLLRLQPLPPPPPAPDQGYASERSPEEELPPPIPPPTISCPIHNPAAASKPLYPFLHNNSTFTVRLAKGTRGLGLSVTGGVDTEEPWPGLIRIKRLFPHQPAWQSGQLAHGDFLLVVNNTSLVGLTNYEALEVLRTTPTDVVLTVCRPPPELQVLSAPPPDSAPLPPRRDPLSSSSLLLPLKRVESFGEFELTLKKVNGSLGFTLRKEDESVLGHYVRALVREPALSDGRIKPGDKIVAVNGIDMSPMSHEEAVMFLRQCGQEVHLKLYRDPAQTPVQALSPTEHHRTFKPILRKEAQDMLTDLAVKKSLSPNESSGSSSLSTTGRTSSPRKRRLAKTPSPDHGAERPENHLSWSNEVLERVTPGFENEKPRRPDSLNFSAERKPHFQFSTMNQSKNEETLNNMDDLDSCGSLPGMDSELGVGPLPLEPVSMPPLLTSTSDSIVGFSYRNPAYRSANPAPSKSKSSLSEDLPENRSSDNDLAVNVNSENCVDGSKGLLKWKGVVFTPEDGADTATSPEDSISQITEVDNTSNHQVLVVELNRGWNSRLGFSLQQSGRNTLISAIHSDSVASRDGRLMAGDQLIMVNDESVEGMSTSEVINLLRKIRGSICITIWRKSP